MYFLIAVLSHLSWIYTTIEQRLERAEVDMHTGALPAGLE